MSRGLVPVHPLIERWLPSDPNDAATHACNFSLDRKGELGYITDPSVSII